MLELDKKRERRKGRIVEKVQEERRASYFQTKQVRIRREWAGRGEDGGGGWGRA